MGCSRQYDHLHRHGVHGGNDEHCRCNGPSTLPAVRVYRMSHWTSDDVIELLVGILSGGRAGGGLPPPPDLLNQMLTGSGHHRSTGTQPTRTPTRFPLPSRAAPKRKRKVSAYQKEFGRQLKRLKKEHPRTPVTRLMKRAHAATKRARRGK
jgi:hypothetical protein